MYCLSIVFNAGTPVLWKLLYRDEKEAFENKRMCHESLHEKTSLILSDDFGQRIILKGENLIGVMVEDLEQSKLVHIELSLHEARVRAKANQMAQADPALRAATMMGGPPVLSPMGGMNGRMG